MEQLVPDKKAQPLRVTWLLLPCVQGDLNPSMRVESVCVSLKPSELVSEHEL